MAGVTKEAAAAETAPKAKMMTFKRVLLLLSCILISIGGSGGPLIMRLYFVEGGKLIWLVSFLQSTGWPVTLIVLIVAYFRRRATNPNAKVFHIRHLAFLFSAIIGVLVGLDNYLYAYGVARLPVSTSSLIIASQLAFTAAFAFILVRHRFTPYSINAVVLLTVGAGILALRSSSDKPEGESNKQYVLGLAMTVGAAFLYGLIMPLIELTYAKARQEITYTLVMEINLVMSFCSSVFCLIGLIVSKDIQAVAEEAREFGLGETRFYVVLVWSAIIWQCYLLGAVGVIFCSSSLLSGIIVAILLPVTEVLALIFFHEKFSGEKGVSLGLSLWGFASYFYGEVTQLKKQKKMQTNIHLDAETEVSKSSTIPNQMANV